MAVDKMTPDEMQQAEEMQQAAELPFTQEDADKALEELKKYKSGKTSVDDKATENQEWWRVRHWGQLNTDKSDEQGRQVGSAYTFNSLINKHADIMDSFPKPNVLARAADDEEEAKALSKILPVILAENNYEEVYDVAGTDLIVDGGAITSVLWDNSKAEGLGDISVVNIDVHNLFWQPGIENIQKSEYVFHVTLEDAEYMQQAWPEYADKIKAHDPADVVKYIHDDHIDFSNCVEVVDCYYKRVVMEMAQDNAGNEIVSVPKYVLHLAKIVGGQLVFCSENASGYEDGYYWHGMYPFVIRRRFRVKDTPWGFGDLDIMKHPQADIDKIDQAVVKHAWMKANPRFWARKAAGINMQEFADWNKTIVEVASGDPRDAIQQIEIDSISEMVEAHYQAKIEELKETSGNRDFSQGATSAGVTAASAIAALQEAGSKLSRDLNKTMYRGSRQEYYLCVELIRQFYTEERSFRIEDDNGGYAFALYSNEGIQPKEDHYVGGIKRRKPVFDIEISAEKQSPFSRAAQNETMKELYQLGTFQPENAQAALVMLSGMEFEGLEAIKQQVQANSVFLQQMQQMQQAVVMAEQMMPGFLQMTGLVQADPMAQMPMGSAPGSDVVDTSKTPEERAASNGESTITANARKRTREATQI